LANIDCKLSMDCALTVVDSNFPEGHSHHIMEDSHPIMEDSHRHPIREDSHHIMEDSHPIREDRRRLFQMEELSYPVNRRGLLLTWNSTMWLFRLYQEQ